MLRVLGLPQDNVLVWQKGLLKPEAAEVSSQSLSAKFAGIFMFKR